MTLLAIDHLSVTFRQGEERIHAVKGASLSINKGEMLALVGESGSGKSVTASAIMGLLPDNAAITADNMLFDDLDLSKATDKQKRTLRGKRMAMIFQEPMSALNPLHTIDKQIDEMLVLHQPQLPRKQRLARVKELLRMVGLEKFLNRLKTYPHQLSGGERQRVMIAMAMANTPDLLIADEPTTALDVTLQTQILSLLKKLQKEQNMAVLLITHDLTIVRRLADRVAVMQAGELVETGETKTLFGTPKHPYTKTLLAAEPTGSALPAKRGAEEIIGCEQLKVHFPIRRGMFGRIKDHVKAVDGISLSLKQRQTIGIVGESGSGKTTLGLALLRLIKSDGPIVFMGKPVNDLSTSALRRLRSEMQIVFQDPYASLNPRLTVGDIIAEGLEVHRPSLNKKDRDDAVSRILAEVGLEETMRHRYPHEFSGGQRQRINIARAMILHPGFVVLDEPTSALDLTIQSQVVDLLKHFQKEHDIGYLFISHDLRVVRAISHRIIVMRQGKIVEEEATKTLLSNPKQDYTKALISAAFDEIT